MALAHLYNLVDRLKMQSLLLLCHMLAFRALNNMPKLLCEKSINESMEF